MSKEKDKVLVLCIDRDNDVGIKKKLAKTNRCFMLSICGQVLQAIRKDLRLGYQLKIDYL